LKGAGASGKAAIEEIEALAREIMRAM